MQHAWEAVGLLLAVIVHFALSGLFTPGQWLMIAGFSLLFELGHAAFGMLVGLRFARLDAANEAQVIKRSFLGFL